MSQMRLLARRGSAPVLPRCLKSHRAGRGRTGLALSQLPLLCAMAVPRASSAGMGQGCWHRPELGLLPSAPLARPRTWGARLGQHLPPAPSPSTSAGPWGAFWGEVTPELALPACPSPATPGTAQPQPHCAGAAVAFRDTSHPPKPASPPGPGLAAGATRRRPPPLPLVLSRPVRLALPARPGRGTRAPWCSRLRLSDSRSLPPGQPGPFAQGRPSPRWLGR